MAVQWNLWRDPETRSSAANFDSHHDVTMRTTVTLSPEVEVLLRSVMKRSGQSFEEVLHQAILKGLADENEGVEPNEEPFVVAARPMGLRLGLAAGRLSSLADDLEADAFLALTNDLTSQAEGE